MLTFPVYEHEVTYRFLDIFKNIFQYFQKFLQKCIIYFGYIYSQVFYVLRYICCNNTILFIPMSGEKNGCIIIFTYITDIANSLLVNHTYIL